MVDIDFPTLKQHTPYAQYQIVDVTFGAAYMDLEIAHTLTPPDPEQVDYVVLRQAQAATIYHDMAGTRMPWQQGAIRLRSNVANARVTLLLTVSHEKRALFELGPAGVAAAPPSHTHSATDITSGTFEEARIPNLAGEKITSGTVADARLSANVALENEANIFTANQRINAGLGINVAPPATGHIALSGGFSEWSRSTRAGEWVSFTPVWTAITTNPSLGNGTLTGKVMRIGKTVFFHISLTMGSTTTFGSGLWLFSTPSNIVSTFHGEARLNDNSAGGPWEQGFNTQSATAEFFASRYDSLGVTATVPFTWATSDVLVLTGMYEEA